MPIYVYECESCGHQDELFRSIEQRNNLPVCVGCDTEMRRNIQGELQGKPQGEWAEPLLSDAAGVHPEQVPEMRQRFPHHEFTGDGRMVFRSRGHQKRCLQDIGMVDFNSYD